MKSLVSYISIFLIISFLSCSQKKKTQLKNVFSYELTQQDSTYYLFPLYNKGLSLLLEDFEAELMKKNSEGSYYPYLLTLLNEMPNNYTLDDTLRYSYEGDTILNINRCFYEGPIKNYFRSSLDLIYVDYDNYILHGCTLINSFDEDCLSMLKRWKIDDFMNIYNSDSHSVVLDSYDDYISRIVINDGLIICVDTMKVMHAQYKR